MYRAAILILSLMAYPVNAQDGGEAPVLTPESSDEAIRMHMLHHELNGTQTGALAEHFPNLSRERAYAVQRSRLAESIKTDEHVGWKLGWTRKASSEEPLDPIVGHYMSERVYQEGAPVATRYFTYGEARAEPEIVFYLKHDLPGPVVTRDELVAAIDSVGIAMEFVNFRATLPATREHAIVDNGIAVGVVLADQRFNLADLNFADIEGRVTVNGEESKRGPSTSIMGEDPLAGLLWAANELPKWGMHLSAGEFVVSGTVCEPLVVSNGDSATIEFTGMGSLHVDLVP